MLLSWWQYAVILCPKRHQLYIARQLTGLPAGTVRISLRIGLVRVTLTFSCSFPVWIRFACFTVLPSAGILNPIKCVMSKRFLGFVNLSATCEASSHEERSACQPLKAGARLWFYECKVTKFFFLLQRKRLLFSFCPRSALYLPPLFLRWSS